MAVGDTSSSSPRYSVRIKPAAEKEFVRLPAAIRERAASVILAFETTPRPVGCQKLHDVDAYRVRIGDYRIVYTIDDKQRTVEVIAVRHRKDVYRRM